MLFWHVGGAVLLFRYLFRDPSVDVRFLVLGAVLPDFLDKPIGLIFWPGFFDTGRVYGHTLVFFAGLLIGGVLVTNRGSVARKGWVAVAVGIMFHLLLDGMWLWHQTLLWPFFGWEFPAGVTHDWSGFRFWLLVQELTGLAYLVWLWTRYGLRDPARRSHFWRTGHLSA